MEGSGRLALGADERPRSVAQVGGGAAEDRGVLADVHDGLGCEVGGFLVLAARTDSWDAIAAVLGVLEQHHHDYFGRVMRGCRRLSNDGHELDGLDDLLSDREQVLFDLAFDREQRREKSGYVSPAQARAFLQMARAFRRGPGKTTSGNPIATAYFRGLEWATADADERGSANRLPPAALAPQDSAQAVAAVVDLLLEAGVLPQQPRALLGGSQEPAPRLARIQALMQFARFWVVSTLGPYWTTRIITVPGAPLVRRGPYRLVRHPNYWVVCVEIAVLPLAFGNWPVALAWSLLNAALLSHRIRLEEQALAGRRT